jgi:hypothetical protein
MARTGGLSTTTVRVLRAAVAAIRPRGHGFDQPIDGEVLDAVVAFFPYLPAPMRLAFPLGLRLLELGPPFVIRRFARFSTLSPHEGRVYLEKLHAGGGPFGALVLGLRALVLMNFYQHPSVLKTLEVDWAGRAVALTERRATLLEGLSA